MGKRGRFGVKKIVPLVLAIGAERLTCSHD
jgi:hypothetical protein